MFWYAKDTLEVTYKNMQNINIYCGCQRVVIIVVDLGLYFIFHKYLNSFFLNLITKYCNILYRKKKHNYAHNYVYALHHINIS